MKVEGYAIRLGGDISAVLVDATPDDELGYLILRLDNYEYEYVQSFRYSNFPKKREKITVEVPDE